MSYIEREAAINAMCRLCSDTTRDKCRIADICNHVCRLEAIPAADVRPVVRGRWEKCVGENGVTSACRCNLCGFEDNRFSMFNYCPNCGAKMKNPEEYE